MSSTRTSITTTASTTTTFPSLLLYVTGSFVLGCGVTTLLMMKCYGGVSSPESLTPTNPTTTNEKLQYNGKSVESTENNKETTIQSNGSSSIGSNNTKSTSTITTLPPEIRLEQLSRHYLYFGDDGMERIKNAKICVVGVGGVGSHTVHMLARAGIGYIRYIDYDYVTVSSLNRHAVASIHDVGIPKVTCLTNYLRTHVCPDPNYLTLDPHIAMYNEQTSERLLRLDNNNENEYPNYKWDLVIDCIDDIPTKAYLIQQCLQHQIRIVSCMGAGGKADFTRLHWSDLRTAAKDPLATKLRQTLKKSFAADKNTNTNDKDDTTNATTNTTKTNSTNTTKRNSSIVKNGRTYNDYLDDMEQVSVLYSSEKTVMKLADFTEEQKEDMNIQRENKKDTTKDSSTTESSSSSTFQQYGAVDGMRIRIVPVLGTMPAIFGQALATICLTITAKKQPIRPVTGERISRSVRNRLYQHLVSREMKLLQQQVQNQQSQNPVATDTLTTKEQVDDTVVVVPPVQVLVPDTFLFGTEILIDQDDVESLYELWRHRCAVSGARLGTVLELVRWDLTQPTSISNLVLVSQNIVLSTFCLQNIDFTNGKPKNMDPKIRQVIERRLCDIKSYHSDE